MSAPKNSDDSRRQALIPVPLRSMMQAGPDLLDHLVRQKARAARRLVRRDAVRDAVEEGAREHVAGAGQVLRLALERGDVRLEAGVADVDAVRAVRDDQRWQ